MKLITNQIIPYHVSLDTVKEFEKNILKDPHANEAVSYRRLVTKITFHAWRQLQKYGINLLNFTKVFQNNLSSNNSYFAVLMGPDYIKCMPYFFFSDEKNIYMFDAWPQNHNAIINFLNYFRVNNAFFSSSQVIEELRGKLKSTKCYWIPEGIDPADYRFYPYEKKDIDVLSIGRKFDKYHEQIINGLEKENKKYFYEKIQGEIVFPTREEFIDGLGRTKISICFPSSITHPERSGNIQTMTIRYLQSMASKCLIVGQAPEEMIKLFGYNPGIEADEQNPAKQLCSILTNYNDYLPLIEKNYSEVLEKHNWQKRWQQISETI